MHNKYNTQKDILFVLISSFIVVVAWISFNLYHIWVTSTISEEVQMQLSPIDPNFDPATIQQLKSRKHIDPLYELQALPSQTISATPTPTQSGPTIQPSSPSASESSSLVPTSEPISQQEQ